MTQYENFHVMMRHDHPQWMPLDITATPPVLDTINQKLGNRNLTTAFDLDFAHLDVAVPLNETQWRAAYADLGVTLPVNAELDFAGTIWLKPEAGSTGAASHLREMMHPLSGISEVKQLEQLPWPDMSDAQLYAKLPDEVRQAHGAGKAAAIWLECSVFEFAWDLRGMDYLFSDLIEGNDISNWLLDWFTQRTIHAGTAYARAGMDVIGLGDDVGTQRGMMMSVDFWREHFKPRLAKIISAIRAAQGERHVYIRYHSDGDIRAIIDDLIEIGVDILNPMQPECMPVADVIRQYKDQLAFWGMIGTQSTMPFGKPADVRAAVAECAQLAREGARVIVAPTHVLEPDVPWENIAALVGAVRSEKL